MELQEFEKIYQEERSNWWYLSRQRITLDYVGNLYKHDSSLKILDLASACGANFEHFGRFGKIIGTDISSESLRFCQMSGFSPFVQADAQNLPFLENSFDMVLGLDCLEHFEDDGEVIRQVYGILKGGGRFIVTVPAYMQLWSAHDEAYHHRRRYTKNELIQELTEHGFDIEFCTYWTFSLLPPLYIFRAIRRNLGGNGTPKSDFFLKFPVIVEKLLATIQFLESVVIKHRVSLPCGVNLFCGAIKR